jgi:hypothetical protein
VRAGAERFSAHPAGRRDPELWANQTSGVLKLKSDGSPASLPSTFSDGALGRAGAGGCRGHFCP